MKEFPLPAHQVEAARAWLASPYPPTPPRPAATVILLREAPRGFEVYTVRRSATMKHTPGVTAFPGGSIRPDDLATPLEPRVPLSQWAYLMGEDEEAAHCLLAAAVREVFEETGVLLAPYPKRTPDYCKHERATGELTPHPEETSLSHASIQARILAERRRVELHEYSFASFLAAYGVSLLLDTFAYRGTWITPSFLPRRYHVAFFTALLPEGQDPQLLSTEASDHSWARPLDLLSQAERGEISLVAPTRFHLHELAQAHSIDEALTHRSRRIQYTPAPSRTSPTGYVLH